jgi:hypothetical protein
VRRQEVPQRLEKFASVVAVSSRYGGANIIQQHVTYFFSAMVLTQQILGQCRCHYFWDVLVLGDRHDLRL